MAKNTAYFAIVPEAVAELMHFPKGWEIVGCSWDRENEAIVLFVKGRDLPDQQFGRMSQIVPHLSWQFKVVPQPEPKLEPAKEPEPPKPEDSRTEPVGGEGGNLGNLRLASDVAQGSDGNGNEVTEFAQSNQE